MSACGTTNYCNDLVAMNNQESVEISEIAALHSSNRKLGIVIAHLLEQLHAACRELAPVFVEIVQNLRAPPDRMESALLQLANRGWYADPEIPAGALLKLAAALDNPSNDVSDVLCSWVDAKAVEIESRLCSDFPLRARVLQQAFLAHNEGRYALSIPVFLAQADGICQDLHGVQLYARRNGEMALGGKLEPIGRGFGQALMLAPMLTPLPIVAHSKDRKSGSDDLNRHAILHGESTGYDTKENGCKAIAFIRYAAWALCECGRGNEMATTARTVRAAG